MTRFSPAPLYPIVDVSVGDVRKARDLAAAFFEAGAPWVQLRAKTLDARAFAELARITVALGDERKCKVLINDRIDIALVSGAAGVHLGQTDLPIGVAREIAPHLVVGVSTHEVGEAREAARAGADYIGFGPIFETATKSDALQRRPAGLLTEVRASVDLPIVAIGGITPETAPGILAAGADSVAMIGALANADDPASTARALLGRPGSERLRP